jgi:hypothetical protein
MPSYSSYNSLGSSIEETELSDRSVTDDKLNSEHLNTNSMEIIELQANATVTPIDHDTVILETFSDADGYNNYVDTGNTTAFFNTNKYVRLDTIQDQQLTDTSNYSFRENAGVQKICITFENTSDCDIIAVKPKLYKVGSPTGTITADIYLADGSHQPTGASLGTSETIDGSALTGSAAFKLMAFSTPISLTASTEYCIVLTSTTTISGSDYYRLTYDAGGSNDFLHDYNGAVWAIAGANREGSFRTVIAGNSEIWINLPTITGTVNATQLLVNEIDTSTGATIMYELVDTDTNTDTNLSTNTVNSLINVDGTKLSGGVLKVLIPNGSPIVETNTPTVRSVALKLWKD